MTFLSFLSGELQPNESGSWLEKVSPKLVISLG